MPHVPLNPREAIQWRLFPGEYLGRFEEPTGHLWMRPDGDLWVSSGHRFARLRDDRWSWLPAPLPPEGEYAFYTGRPAIWYGGVCWLGGPRPQRFVDDVWQDLPPCPFQAITHFVVDRGRGRLWASALLAGLWWTEDGTAWHQLPLPGGATYAMALYIDPTGDLWACAGDTPRARRVLHRWDGTAWATVPGPARGRFGDVRTMLADRRGGFWMGCEGYGLWRYADCAWERFPGSGGMGQRPGLPGSLIGALLQDRRDRVWALTDQGLGVYEAGVWRLAEVLPRQGRGEEGWHIWMTEFNHPNNLYLDDDGRLWLTTMSGDLGWLDTTRDHLGDPRPRHLSMYSSDVTIVPTEIQVI